MEVIVVARTRRSDDATEDVGPLPNGLCQAMKETRVVQIARASRRPMRSNAYLERAAEMTRQPLDLGIARESRKVEALQIERIAQRVLADATTPASCRSAVEASAMHEPSRCASVVLFGERVDQLLEGFESLDEWLGHEHLTRIAHVRAAMPNQTVTIAAEARTGLDEARRLIQRIAPDRPPVEKRKVRDLRTIFGPRRTRREQDEGHQRAEAEQDAQRLHASTISRAVSLTVSLTVSLAISSLTSIESFRFLVWEIVPGLPVICPPTRARAREALVFASLWSP